MRPPSSEATRGSCTRACGATRWDTSSSQSGPSRWVRRRPPSSGWAAKGTRKRTPARWYCRWQLRERRSASSAAAPSGSSALPETGSRGVGRQHGLRPSPQGPRPLETHPAPNGRSSNPAHSYTCWVRPLSTRKLCAHLIPDWCLCVSIKCSHPLPAPYWRPPEKSPPHGKNLGALVLSTAWDIRFQRPEATHLWALVGPPQYFLS